ncbi:MAG: hypothetical protein LBV12_01290, partial [Puniceicoccales bacterium]|nr:hypothetical protein [Puniceicoccales bacterium]
VLYHRDARLPDDWIPRAKQALLETWLPGFQWSSLFYRKNLFPFFALILATFLVLATTTALSAAGAAGSAAKPMDAYKAADFLVAEHGWREQIKHNPTDWTAHYNLSLALAQQDRWGESASQAIVALVQHPRDPLVRWQLHLALNKGGYLPEPIKPFANETPQASLAGLCSPAEWQHILYGGVFLVASGIMIALLRGYRFCGKWAYVVSGLILFSGAIVIAAALYSLRTYGPLSDERAAIVWKTATLYSVPTEADEEQKTTPVSPGSIVLVQKDYLGWRQVTFPNGQTGWIRADNLTSVWE